MNETLKILFFCVIIFVIGLELKPQNKIEQKQFIRVIRGDNLWNISRRVYGSGSEFTKLWDGRLDSNISQDPDFILPNMGFLIGNQSAVVPIPIITNENDKMNFKEIVNDVDTIKKATVSIDENLKIILKQKESNIFVKIFSYLFNEIFIVTLTGVISTILANYWLTKKKID
jgi:hypothetical protein